MARDEETKDLEDLTDDELAARAEADIDELSEDLESPGNAESLEAPEDEDALPPLADDPEDEDLAPAPTDPGITTTDDTIPCPYCGEPVDLFLEPSGQRTKEEFVEECPACSRDIEVTVEYDDAGTPHIHAGRPE